MSKILFICINGASWLPIEYLLQRNKLPTIKRLIDGGLKKTLFNFAMINRNPDALFLEHSNSSNDNLRLGVHFDAESWVTLITGITPDKHGISASTQKGRMGLEEPISGRKRKKPAVWEILARNDKKIVTIGGLASQPHISMAIRQEKGILCSDSYPKRLMQGLRKIEYDKEIENFLEKSPQSIREIIISDNLSLKKAEHILGKLPQPDMLTISLNGIHDLSHLFWDCLSPEKEKFKGAVHNNRRKKYSNIIEDYYVYLDKRINKLMKLIEKNSVVFIVSGFGMMPSRITKKYFLMDKIYEFTGFLKLKGKKVDWANTRVYDDRNPWGIGSLRKGYIKSNNPATTFRKLKACLGSIKTQNNEPLFLKIELTGNKKEVIVAPNYKAIHYSTKIFFDGKRPLPAKKVISFKPHYSLHSPQGILIIRSNNNRCLCGKVSLATNLDIVPTVLNLLNVKHEDKNMIGRSLF